MDPLHPPGRGPWRGQLLALLQAGDVDAALQAGLMEFPASPADAGDAPLVAAQARLRTAWQARERHRMRAARLQRIAAEREARRQAAAPAAASGPALPPAAAAALARARARAATGRKP